VSVSAAEQLESAVTFGLVFGFAIRYRLPLHVVGRVGSSALKRIDMINYIAWAATSR
jgi:hypothetical protein